MLNTAAGVLAIAGYLLATVLFAAPHLLRAVTPGARKTSGLALVALGLLGHAVTLQHSSFMPEGLNISLVNAASLVSWCVTALLLALLCSRPLESLAVVILPLAALSLGFDLGLPTTHLLAETLAPGLRIHIALALVAYSLFALAALQALFLAIAERKLRQHHPIMHFLPPLPTMETVMFQLTLIAFGLLTFSLALGAMYIEDIRAQHLAHKIVFSVLAWGVFAVLVLGRWRFGWRGRHGVKYVWGGFLLLAFAYFGTKIVLEFVLHRL